MPTVTIGADTYNTYVDQATAATYFNGRAGGAVWLTYTADDRARGLVSATRWLDLQAWVGTKTSPSQPMEWPRDGVVDRDGVAVPNTVIPADIQAGCCELALALLQDPSIQESATGTSSNTKKLEAKGVSIEYFGPTLGSLLPTACNARVAFYYASSSASSSAYVATKAYGICTTCCYTECRCPQIFPHQYDLGELVKFLGVDFAKEIDKGFRAAGMGTNVISTITLQKRTPGTATAGHLTAGNNPTFTAYPNLRGFVSEAKVGFMVATAGEAGGLTLVRTGDKVANIFGNSLPQSGGLPSVEPAEGDLIVANGQTYTIYFVDPGAPTGALYACTMRA